MADKNELELNAAGEVVLRPVTGWVSAVTAGIYVTLRVQYIEAPQDFGTERERHLQVGLTAPQARELAEILQKQAGRIESPPPRLN
jgi:hypothetical protein